MKILLRFLSAPALAGLFVFASAAWAHDGHDHHDATAAAKHPDYPLTTCVVSGDSLYEMGDPVEYVYQEAGQPDRLVLFCCKDCVKDFTKDPSTYLKKLDEAEAAKAKAPQH